MTSSWSTKFALAIDDPRSSARNVWRVDPQRSKRYTQVKNKSNYKKSAWVQEPRPWNSTSSSSSKAFLRDCGGPGYSLSQTLTAEFQREIRSNGILSAYIQEEDKESVDENTANNNQANRTKQHQQPPPPTNPYSNIPIIEGIRTLGVPKNRLCIYYSRRYPHYQISSKTQFKTWNDDGPQHRLGFTSEYTCGVFGDVYRAGRWKDLKEGVDYWVTTPLEEEEEGMDHVEEKDGGHEDKHEIVWYRTKKDAEHAASARALDCLYLLDRHLEQLQLNQETPSPSPSPSPSAPHLQAPSQFQCKTENQYNHSTKVLPPYTPLCHEPPTLPPSYIASKGENVKRIQEKMRRRKEKVERMEWEKELDREEYRKSRGCVEVNSGAVKAGMVPVGQEEGEQGEKTVKDIGMVEGTVVTTDMDIVK